MLTLLGIVFLTLMMHKIYLTKVVHFQTRPDTINVLAPPQQLAAPKFCHLRWIPILYNNAPPVWPFQGKLHSANYIKAKRGSTQKILPKCEDMKKTYWRKGTTKSGLAAYLEIFVSYNIKRSLSSRTQRKNLARMQYLEMFPRQNALSASCKASLKHSLCVIFYKVVKSSTDRMTLQGLQVMFLPITSGQLIWGTDIIFKINRNLGTY